MRMATLVLGLAAATGCSTPGPRLAVFHNHLATMAEQRGVSLREAVRAVRSWGIEGVDVFEDFDRGESREMHDLGLSCAAYIVSADLGAKDETEKLAHALAEAKARQAAVVMLVPGQVPKGMTREAAWQAAKPRIADFVERAGREGLRVALEDYDWGDPIVGSAAHLRQAFREVPALGHVLDTGNYDRWGEDPAICAKEFALRVLHVHAKDRAADGSSRAVAAGTGRIPFAPIFSTLKSVEYDGWVTIECFGASDMWTAVEAAAKNLKKWR